MKVKVGDKVKIITGADKGKEGKVLKTFALKNQVVVEGIKIVKKHMKPNGADNQGGIIEREARIDASNVKKILEKEVKKVVKKDAEKTAPKKKTTKKTSEKAK